MLPIQDLFKKSRFSSAVCGLILLSLLSGIKSEGFYKVIGSKVIRPNSEFHVSVTTSNSSLPTLVKVLITGQSFTGRTFSTGESVLVQPYTTRISSLQIDDIDDGNYRLSVSGEGGVIFDNQLPLTYKKKSYSVFIQTDKAVYKPGDLILFRSIILNSNLKPVAEVRNKPIHVHISDGRGNKVKEWNNVYAPRGVFNAELRLSDSPVLGNWNISVTIQKQTFNKQIQIATYILPKFSIRINAPRHVTFQQNIFTADIESFYDYGKKVQGDATITVYPTIVSGVIQPIYQNPIRKVIPIDGRVTVNFDIGRELTLNDEYERTVVVDVTIQEALTGRRQNNSIEVQLHKYDYKVEFVKTSDYYKPGMLYTAYLKVSNYDGSPLEDDRRIIKLRYGFSRADEVYIEEEKKLNTFGVASLEVQTPTNSTNEIALRIEAEYLDLKEKMSPVPAAVSPSKNFMQIYLESDRHVINKDVIILVNCTEPMKYINYELMGRGDVLLANTFQVDNRRIYKFRFTATHAMVPTAHLLVSYIRADGELIADSTDIEIEGLLQNFIDVGTNILETQPGTDIDLTVRTQPHSYIGLLAVDENVAKLRSGYDLTRDDVYDELKMYDASRESPYSFILKTKKSHFYWKPGASNSRDMFDDSGALLLTNSRVINYRPTLEDVYLRPVSYGSSTVKPDRGLGVSLSGATRPPLAGPYAFSRIPRPISDKPKVYLSENIFDTWLFTNFSSSYEGQTSVRKRIPNSITNWIITGFSLDYAHGLGLMSQPITVKVSKPFRITANLPYAVQRGEILAVPIVVYNNLDYDITAEVVLHNPEQRFDFEGAFSKKIELYRKKKLQVNKNSRNSVSFMIVPSKIGETEIKITASSSNIQDSVVKMLSVTAGGETEFYTKTILIDLRSKPSYKSNVTVDFPEHIVEGSEKIEISAVADLLGPLILNSGNLIRLPTSCGEQNLINFVSNVILLNYLRNTGQLSPTIEQDAVKNLEIAYQEQLNYRLQDGSFGVFGKITENGSIWITSYTILSLIQAKPFIYIDETVIQNGLEWLSNHQNVDGRFLETGSTIYFEAQKSDPESLALTAFTLMPFLENRIETSLYTNLIEKGLDYISRHVDDDIDVYSLSVCTYVAYMAKHSARTNFLNLLDSKAITGKYEKWWSKATLKNDTKNPWDKLPRTMDIETTSYALLSLLEADLIADAVPVVHWLINQGNTLGGFTSTQDTRAALMALYRLVLRFTTESNMNIQYEYLRVQQKESNNFFLNRNNAMIIQKSTIPNDVKVINITSEGKGIAMVRISYQYNKNVTGPWPMFTLDPQVSKNSNQHHMQLAVCTAFVSKNLTEYSASNMAVMEVNLPTGFTADVDSLPSLEISQNVQKVETKNGDTTVVLYFNNITREEYCPTVLAFRTHKVAKQKPVAVIVYDYYDSSRRARVFYGSKRSRATVCDICDNEDCVEICSNEPKLRPLQESDKNGNQNLKAVINLIIIMQVILLITFVFIK